MGAAELQALLRFLSRDAKLPLAVAMSRVQALQRANFETPAQLAAATPKDLTAVFGDEKTAAQVSRAARRVAKANKNRGTGKAGDGPSTSASTSSSKKQRGGDDSLFAAPPVAPAQLEESLALPESDASEEDLAAMVVFSNRAPLVLAFVVTLLKHTMPAQPLSSRLSLAQAYVSTTSRSRAVYLGLENGRSAEEEGYGEGQPSVTIMGKTLHIIRRYGYEWRQTAIPEQPSENEPAEASTGVDDEPALWALDLEALKKSNVAGSAAGRESRGTDSSLPIYTPQSARAYLVKSFDSPPSDTKKRSSAASKHAEKEQNLGHLLRSLDMLYQSWAGTLDADELDKRTWSWYVKARPAVEDGVAGWGGKNQIRLADILALRR